MRLWGQKRKKRKVKIATLDPALKKIGNELWVLTAPFQLILVFSGCSIRITVESGFKTDLASIPYYLRWIVPKRGSHDGAALTHDHLLRLVKSGDMTYALADAIFIEVMRYYGVPKWKRSLMWFSVRIFGSSKRAIKNLVNAPKKTEKVI